MSDNGLTLYHLEHSTCSQKVRLVLAEKGLGYESRIMDWQKTEHLSDWYLALNPNAVVPTLTHHGKAVVDSSVICEYLDEAFPARPLTPVDPLERARMRSWMRYFEEVPTAAIRVPSFNHVLARTFKAMGEEAFEAYIERLPLRKHFYKQLGDAGFNEATYKESMERLDKCLRRVSDTLADGRPFLLGDNYSIADILLVPTVVRLDDLGLNHVWADMPRIEAWYGGVKARPSFDLAYIPGSRMHVETFHMPMTAESKVE